MTRWPLGVVDVVYWGRGDVVERADAAKADGDLYGEPNSSGGPSGRTCHHDWPAAASQSTNRYASRSSFPDGKDVG